tara:strand:- start:235 stop:525 length:291 start_codon:yes stop_codon:yes gene_type:complete
MLVRSSSRNLRSVLDIFVWIKEGQTMEKWEYKITRVILSNQVSFNETQNEVNDKINEKQVREFNQKGEDGWELVQILPRSKEDKFHVDLAMWKRRK